MTVNQELQDIQITHTHYVERFKTYETNRIIDILNTANSEIKKKLLSADITAFTKRRYESLLKSIEELEQQFSEQYNGTLRTDLKDFGQSEAKFNYNSLDKTINSLEGLNLSFKLPGRSAIWSIANADPLMMDGGYTVDLSQFLKGISNRRLDTIRQTLRQGYITGQSSAEMSRALVGNPTNPGSLIGSRNAAQIIVRTSMNHLASTAKTAFAKENRSIIKGYEWVSVLDQKTSSVCQYRDSRVWIYDDEERTNYSGRLLEAEYHPPAHPRCRSVETFITRSYRELGLNIDEVPPQTRAAMNGTAPGGTTYRDWLNRQPATIQKDVLGATRYEMYKSGDIKFTQLYKPDGNMYTLDQLHSKGFEIPEDYLRYVRP